MAQVHPKLTGVGLVGRMNTGLGRVACAEHEQAAAHPTYSHAPEKGIKVLNRGVLLSTLLLCAILQKEKIEWEEEPVHDVSHSPKDIYKVRWTEPGTNSCFA